MDASGVLRTDLDARGVCRVVLNRPQSLNALDADLVAALLERLEALERDPNVRLVVLGGAGTAFCSGGDIRWMQELQQAAPEAQEHAAKLLAALMHRLDSLARPTVAQVHGSAFGGGTGLVACCDIAIASTNARFAFSEVRLGLAPVVIAPYVIRAIGRRQARRYFLSAETFDGLAAERIGLVHQTVPPVDLNRAIETQIALLLQGAPEGQAVCKRLTVRTQREPERIAAAGQLATLWASDEAREGLRAFLDKRRPVWSLRSGEGPNPPVE